MSGAYPSRIALCGRSIAVRRSFELMARLEERFGPLGPLQARARTGELTATEYAELLDLIVLDCSERPSEAEIRRWIFEAGISAAIVPAAGIVSALFIGAEAADKLDRRDADADDDEEGEPILNPRTAASDGTGFSAPLTPSDGGPATSGAPRSTS